MINKIQASIQNSHFFQIFLILCVCLCVCVSVNKFNFSFLWYIQEILQKINMHLYFSYLQLITLFQKFVFLILESNH